MRSLGAIAIALSASLMFIPAPASADSATPSLAYPLERIGDTVDVEVMVQAPLKAWGIRRAAMFYDSHVDGLTIHTRGTCAARPQAVCVRVYIDTYSDEEMLAISYGAQPVWQGITTYLADATGSGGPTAPRDIHLNLRYGLDRAESRWVATHELGHALGLDHHDGVEGVMGIGLNQWPSTGEIDALRAWYSVPRA